MLSTVLSADGLDLGHGDRGMALPHSSFCGDNSVLHLRPPVVAATSSCGVIV